MDRRRGRHRRITCGERGLNEHGGQGASDRPLSPRALDAELNSVITWIDTPNDSGSGSLAGMRIGVKDNIDVAGVVTTCASRFFESAPASTTDAEVIRRLTAAGATITAKLNMAEFAVGVTSANSAAGATINPWNATRVPGGSSGGSGAAVAAGIVDAALGTDTGGSVRLPASACGITGLRPTRGAISNSGVFPVSEDFDTVGPMARSVSTVQALFDVLADRTPTSAPVRSVRRIGVPAEFITSDVDPGVASTVAAAAEVLASLGYELVPVDIPGAADAQDIVYTSIYYDLAQRHHRRITEQPDLFQDATRERISLGLSISSFDRRAAQAARRRFCDGVAAVFDAVDLVLTPTMPVDVPQVGDGDSVVALSRRMGQFTYPWSLHDGPTLAVPVGFHPESGMPVGAQLTAPAHHEQWLFDVGTSYQSVTDWHAVEPPWPVAD